MGNSLSIMCTRCNYRKQLLTGIGMLHTEKRLMDPSSNVLSNIIESKKEYDYVRKLLHEKEGVFRRYGFRIMVCSRCGEFQSHFYYEIIHKDGIHKSPLYCEKCKANLIARDDIWYEVDVKKHRCPECGELALEQDFSEIFLWD